MVFVVVVVVVGREEVKPFPLPSLPSPQGVLEVCAHLGMGLTLSFALPSLTSTATRKPSRRWRVPPPPAHPPAAVRFLPPPQPSLCHHKPLTPTPVSAMAPGGRGDRWVALGKPEICQGSDSSRFQAPTAMSTTLPLHPPFFSMSCHSMLLSASHLFQHPMLGTLVLGFSHPPLTGVFF